MEVMWRYGCVGWLWVCGGDVEVWVCGVGGVCVNQGKCNILTIAIHHV